MLQHNKIANIYNPLNQSYEELLTNFVIRKKEFNKIRKELKVLNEGSSIQHFLIEGQRGTGKTTLLLRLRYEIENNKEFSHLVAVQFGEEQYGIYDLCRVWENVAEILEDIEGFETLSDELDKRNEDKDYSTECFSIVEKYLKKNNKRLVLMLDNFGDILDKLSEIEQKRLRDTLHESKYVQLITATSRTLEYTYKHDQPFFEFFKKIKLEGLDKENTQILLEQLSMNIGNGIQNIINNQPNRIEVIRRLTGGIPRTIVLLFEIFLDDSANVFEDLEAILDRVTPLYKHRMDDLPTQQQAIMDTIALNWDGISTKEITEGLKKRGFNTKQVSSQLKVLERHDLIESRFVDKKNKVYLIKERFFNIWYLMRYGRRKSKQQVLWLVRFLEEWCSDIELEERAKTHIQCAKDGNLSSKGHYMANAIASLIKDRNLQHEVLESTKESLKKYDSKIDKKMTQSDKNLDEKATQSYHDEKYDIALKSLNQIQNKSHITYSNMAVIYKKLENYEQAIEYYKKAITIGSVSAINSLAYVYEAIFKDYEKAIQYYKQAVDKDHVLAMRNLGYLYRRILEDNKETIKYYKMASEKGDIEATNELADIYSNEMNNYNLAVKYYKMAIEHDDPGAMNNLAYLYYDRNINKIESLELTRKSIKIEEDYYNTLTHAKTLLWNDYYEESIKYFSDFITEYTYDEFLEFVTDYFILLLAKKQYNLAYKLFMESEDLQNQMKPIYYALMKILKDKYPKEYLKMGSELEETVEEILIKVEKKRGEYC